MIQQYQPLYKIVADVGKELGLNVRAQGVLGSTDPDTSQVAYLIIDTCDELLTRFPWRTSIGSNPWVVREDGTFAFELVNDNDKPLFDARTLKAGAKWRYLNTKGLTYDEMFRVYENRIQYFAFARNKDNVVGTNVPASIPV